MAFFFNTKFHQSFKFSLLKGAFHILRSESKTGFLNPKESENKFCASLIKKSIQDLLDHGASKEPKNPLPSGF